MREVGNPRRAAEAVAVSLAEQVLEPSAAAVDASPLVPVSHLDALASAGLYGLTGPVAAGGLGLAGADAARIVERLASGCLTTTFVWLQHQGALARVAAGENAALHARWLAPLCAGSVRAGIAFSALRRPGPPAVSARRVPGGWSLTGSAPWVTGWGRIDLLYAAARAGSDVVWLLLDARAGAALSAEALDLSAVQASGTVVVHLDGLVVPDERVVGIEAFDAWLAQDRMSASLRMNSSLSLGVGRRCSAALGGRFDAELDAARTALDRAAPAALPAAHARAAALALAAAARLLLQGGGSGMLRSRPEQRLGREALFLQVFGQTPAVKHAQLGGT